MPSRRKKRKDGDVEVVLLHHVTRPGVNREHEAPSAGTVGLGLKGVPSAEALERYVQVLQRRGDEEQAGGKRHVQVFCTLRRRWTTS